MTDFVIRDYVPESDLPMIANSWMSSALDTSPLRVVGAGKRAMSMAIDRCLKRSQTYVYSLDDESDAIVSWLCVDNDVIHYIYTKLAYRNSGFAKQLVTHAQQKTGYILDTFSHWPRVEGNERILSGMRYVPGLFWDNGLMAQLSGEFNKRDI